jgi:hypothetical protein
MIWMMGHLNFQQFVSLSSYCADVTSLFRTLRFCIAVLCCYYYVYRKKSEVGFDFELEIHIKTFDKRTFMCFNPQCYCQCMTISGNALLKQLP